MIETLKPINQTGLKTLIKERIENPEKYVNTPLIIWRSDIRDGIQKRILDEVFEEFNANKSTDDRQFYRVSTLLNDYDFNTPEVIRNDVKGDAYGKYKFGLLVIDPAFRPKEDSLDIYYSAINSRRVGDITLLPDVPIVAFMSNNNDWFETPEKYPEAEQYVFQPDFEEWAEWALKDGGFPQLIIDFIRGDGEKSITYRWYNYFNTPPGHPRPGCDYPTHWNEVKRELRREMNRTNVTDISGLSEEQLIHALHLIHQISPDIKKAFCLLTVYNSNFDVNHDVR